MYVALPMRTGVWSMACVPGCVVNGMCAIYGPMAADRVKTGDIVQTIHYRASVTGGVPVVN